MRIVPKIDLSGFEHRTVDRKIRLRNGILVEEGTPPEKGRPHSRPMPSPASLEAVRIDRQRLQGVWKVVSGAISGRPGSADAKIRWTISGDKVAMECSDRWEDRYTLDPARSPKRINLVATSPEGTGPEEIRGVYEVRGDDLCVCLAFGDDPRPEALRSGPGTKEISLILKRQPKHSLPKIRVAADGRTFVTEEGKPFVPMGVTYYRPGTGWAPQVWKKFDAEATRRDFARMKQWGVNCVRVFLSYGSFFTEPDSLSAKGLAKFDQFLAIAEAAGIYVHPTGPDHWEGVPRWAARDRIADERILTALETFWTQFARRYRGRSVIFAYDLRNEPEVGWDGPAMQAKWNAWLQSRYQTADKAAQAWGVSPQSIHWGNQPPPAAKDSPGGRQLLDYQHFREDVADAWTRRQAAAIKAVDPQALVTVGMIQWSVPALLPGVRHYAAFRPERQAKFLDFLEIHFYPLESGFFDYRSQQAEERNLAYLESVVREVAAPGKPVVVGEFGWYSGKLTIRGGRHPAATEEQQSHWCTSAIRTSQGLATGWLNWGFYDQPEARDVSQGTGLFTSDGKPKAWARDFRRMAETLCAVRGSRAVRGSPDPAHVPTEGLQNPQGRPSVGESAGSGDPRRARGRALPERQLGPRPALDWDRCITSTRAGRLFREEYFRAFEAERK